MKSKLPDVVATVHFLETKAGGRNFPTPDTEFRCIMTLDESHFDVRLDLESTGNISPGQTALVPISFLDPARARKYCSVGKEFSLREANKIGTGVIEKVLLLDEGGTDR